jgi:ATP-dependent Zn protease
MAPDGFRAIWRNFDQRLPLIAVGVAVVLSVLWVDDLIDTLKHMTAAPESLTYSHFLEEVSGDRIAQVKIYEVTGRVVGVRKDGTEFETLVPGRRIPDVDTEMFDRHNLDMGYQPSRPKILPTLLLLWLLPICSAIVFASWWRDKPLGEGTGYRTLSSRWPSSIS